MPSEGRSLLHFSGESGNTEVVKYLLNEKLGVDLQSDDGRTPLHLAAGEDTLRS
jgi:ankyrin repeat protein